MLCFGSGFVDWLVRMLGDVGNVKQEAIQLVGKLSELQLLEISSGFKLTAKEGKTDRKKALHSVIVRYLASEELEESDDEGLAVYQQLISNIGAMLADEQQTALEDDVEKKLAALRTNVSRPGFDGSGGGSSLKFKEDDVAMLRDNLGQLEDREVNLMRKLLDEAAGKHHNQNSNKNTTNDNDINNNINNSDINNNNSNHTTSTLHRLKLREFKIVGTIGTEDNAIDWDTLSFQMREGKGLGFSEKEIRSGVIKAMKSGSSCRKYFQGAGVEESQKKFMSMLMNIYDIKDSTELLDEMVNCVQEPKQSEKNYVLKMMGLRDTILTVTAAEEDPLGEKRVRKRMLHAISVGLRNNTVRTMLQDTLEELEISDEKLLKKVNQVVSRDEENKKRMGSGKSAGVNQVLGAAGGGSSGESAGGTKEDSQVIQLIAQLQVELQNQNKSMQDLQKQFNEYVRRDGGGAGGSGGRSNAGGRNQGDFRFPKCAACERTNAFCTHCSRCGDPGHKRRECTLNC